MNSERPPTTTAPMNVVPLDAPPKRRPGRPRSIRRAPDAEQLEQQERVRERLRRHIAGDPVVMITSERADRRSAESLDTLMMQIALEAAGLAWARERAQVEGRRDRESERIASRRISALSRIGDLALERARLGETHFDPRDPRVQAVMREFLGRMREAAEQTLDPDAVERFFESFNARAMGWESKVD